MNMHLIAAGRDILAEPSPGRQLPLAAPGASIFVACTLS